MLVASLPEDVGSMLPRGLFKDGSKSISLYGISPPSDMGRYVHTLEIHPLGGGRPVNPMRRLEFAGWPGCEAIPAGSDKGKRAVCLFHRGTKVPRLPLR